MMTSLLATHGMCRTCSTYVWKKFRDHPDFTAFYQPLHLTLATFTNDEYIALHRDAIDGKMRHPGVDSHYWSEYHPIADIGGGVKGFLERFGLDNFVLNPGDEDFELESYLSCLVQIASDNAQTPFMKFNHADLRAEWIAQNFDVVSIYLMRHPGQVLASYLDFPQRDYHFISYMANIVYKNANHPVFAEFAKWSGLDRDEKIFLEDDLSKPGKKRIRNVQFCADMTGFFWALGLGAATRYADLVLDVNAIGHEVSIEEIQDEVLTVSGYNIDFSDFTLAPKNLRFYMTSDAQEITKRALIHVQPNWDRLRSFTMSRHNEFFVSQLSATPAFVSPSTPSM